MTPCLTNICGGIVGVVVVCWGVGFGIMLISGGVGCGDISLLLLADDRRNASSTFLLLSICVFSAGSERRNVKFDEIFGSRRTGVPDGSELFGDTDMEPPRGLCDRRFGDGVSGGLPGSEGAHTICSGVTDSLPIERFSFCSIMASMSRRLLSFEFMDENEKIRSRD